jgi:RNA polymerase sigma-70 factor (ECF subfamily)
VTEQQEHGTSAGEAPPLTLTPTSGERTEPVTLQADRPVLVGRCAEADLRLSHESVSKRHARLECVERTWHVTDLGSLNGTYKGGVRLEPEQAAELVSGEELAIGKSIFRVCIGPETRGTGSADPYRTRATIFLRLRAADDETREMGWEDFRSRYAPVIVGFARNAGLRAQDADDVLQTVMLNFFRVASTFEYDPSRGRFRGYLKRATLNVIRKRLRKRDPAATADSAALAEDEDQTERLWEEHWAEQMMARAVQEARSRFDPRTFEAFDLYARRGVPAQAVAERLDMGVNSIHQAKSRVMSAIMEIVERLREEEG